MLGRKSGRGWKALLQALLIAVRAAAAFKFVSIGSDDWGRWSGHGPAWPDNATRQLFWDEGLWLSGGEPSRATAETQHDLDVLYSLLDSINTGVPRAHRAVLTPFWVVAGPDFDAMRDSGCPGLDTCAYRELWWHNSTGGLGLAPFERGDLRAAYRAGFERGFWHPEYHGRAHFDTRAWTAYVAAGEPVTSLYFDNGLTYYHYGRRNESSGLFHSTHSEYRSDDHVHQRPLSEMGSWISEGVAAFEEFWGFPAKVTALPCHYGFDNLGPLFKSAGIFQVEGEKSGRGLLTGLQNMFRVLFDPVFEPVGFWRQALTRAQEKMAHELEQSDHIALQWHAANSLSTTLSPEELLLLQDLFREMVTWLRERCVSVYIYIYQ